LLAAASLLGAAIPAQPAPVRTLQIVQLQLQQYDGGPPLAPGTGFLTGDVVFLTFHIGGYQVSPQSTIDLAYTIDAVDPDGVPVVETTRGAVATHVSPEDKDWMPIVRGSVALPALAWSGAYRVKLAVEDKLSHQSATTEIEIPVRGRKVEPSPTLTERNFRFLRSEEDADPLLDPIYHPGDSVWARFEFTGFRYGPKNHIHVEYGIAMLAASGTSLFSQPQAAVEDDESFYPKRYLSGILSLNLQKNILPGQYTVVLTLRDEVGNQTQESRHPFRVER
jgi:hypothetical protein